MRVLINTLFIKPKVWSGSAKTVPEALFWYLSKASNGLGIELFMLVSRTNEAYWRHILPNVGFVVLPFPTHNKFMRVAFEQIACHWAVQKVRADVFYSVSGALPFVPLPCKTVMYFHNILFFHFKEFYNRRALKISWSEWFLNYWLWDFYSRRICILSLKRATEVSTVSRSMALEIQQYVGVVRQGPIRVIPCGMNTAFRPDVSMGRPVPYPYILSVSRILPHKNYEACIKVFESLRHRYQLPHVLHIIGSGRDRYLQSLKDLAAELGVGELVKFTGHVPNQSLPGWYVHADAFMLTSACESFGLPVIEAMACGTPVLTSNLSGLPATVGDAGITADPARTQAFADQLYCVLTDEDLRHRLRKRGLERAAGFSWERAAQATIELMLKALNS